MVGQEPLKLSILVRFQVQQQNHMRLTEREKKNLIIKKSRNGRGIFTRKAFVPEETIFQVVGKRIECNEEDDIDDETRNNTYRFDEDLYISPAGRIGDFLNHSCEPNAKVVKKNNRLFIVAVSLIPEGQEVTIDYSTIIASDDSWDMKCNCGTKSCRGLVKEFKSLPPATKKKYLSLGMVPAYILT
jgi:uncharacterized protein